MREHIRQPKMSGVWAECEMSSCTLWIHNEIEFLSVFSNFSITSAKPFSIHVFPKEERVHVIKSTYKIHDDTIIIHQKRVTKNTRYLGRTRGLFIKILTRNSVVPYACTRHIYYLYNTWSYIMCWSLEEITTAFVFKPSSHLDVS